MWSKTIFLENLYFCIWFSFVFSHGMCILCIANMLLPLSSEDECFVFQWFVLLLFDCHFIQARFFFSHMCTVLLAAYCRMSSAIHMHGSPSWALLYVSLSAAITSPCFEDLAYSAFTVFPGEILVAESTRTVSKWKRSSYPGTRLGCFWSQHWCQQSPEHWVWKQFM